MKSLNWNNIQATADGEFERLPAGPYVARIIEATDKPDKEYVELLWDIAEGPKTGYYDDSWGQSHPFAHRLVLSYKDTALGMLKGRLEAIAASNPGFDPFAAWDGGRVDMFRGRLIGINLQEEEYERNDGEIGTRLNVCAVMDAQKVRDGLVKTRDKKTLDGKPAQKSTQPAAAPTTEWNGEVPFD